MSFVFYEPPPPPQKRCVVEKRSIAKSGIPSHFNVLLGGGGFADIYGSKVDTNTVIKAIRGVSKCSDAKDEFLIHQKIFKNLCLFNNEFLNVPKPGHFSYLKNNPSYLCIYEMEKVFSPRADNIQLQLSFNADNSSVSSINQIVGRFHGLPIDSNNPPRGYFMSLDRFIVKFGVGFTERVTYSMGRLSSIISIISNYNGADVEYLLTRHNTGLKLTALDFGLCKSLPDDAKNAAKEIFKVFDLDLYFPSPTEHTYYALLCLYGFISINNKLDKRQEMILNHFYVTYINNLKKELFTIYLKTFLGSLYNLNLVTFLMNQEKINNLIFVKFDHKNKENNLSHDLFNKDLNVKNSHWRMENLDFGKIKKTTLKFKKHISILFQNFVNYHEYDPKSLMDFILKNV